ncbi:type II secretion system GspH family protein [Microbacterium sp. KUDC0406]|uniref:pilus assembly PilX family protein n=1 Tax=Microbacterium sp. KUDC0406 TaxID=2909588 RepID=UPI001F2A2C09|nr:type II secretion system protein [Microbacterium sp. KUDC0406]UJP10275.1 type II secretion system GspH family protein [Microbacterium sp. KUDC0406]
MLVNRLRNRRREDDETGSTLVAVLIVMIVLTIGGVALSAIIVNTTGSLVNSNDRAKAQAAVDAGIAAQTARLESGELPCAAASDHDRVDGTGTPRYDYTVICGGGVATLTATATVGDADVSRQAVFSVTGGAKPPTAGGPGLFYTYGMDTRLNSYVFDEIHSEVGIDEFTGSAGVFASLGDIKCGGGSVFPGDIYTKTGGLQLDTGCLVKGNAYIGGKANVNGGTIEGSLVAPMDTNHNIAGVIGKSGGDEGNAFLGGTFTLNAGTIYGSVTAAGADNTTLGSGTIHGNFRYRGGYSTWGTPATTIVKGGLVKDSALTAPTLPEIPVWQDVSFTPVNSTTPPQAWADEGYKLVTVTGAACGKWSGNSADVTSVAGALSSKTVFDIRGCSGNFDTNSGDANKEVKVNRDIAVIANKWFLSGTKFKSADGDPHTIFLITPDGNPAAAGPQCTSPAADSQQLNDSTVDPKIAIYIYTPCGMKFNSGSATFRGQVYAGGLSFGGGVKVAFAPRHIPGQDFGEDVEPWPGGGGGGGAALIFSLVSTRDVPAGP